ncbi:hypothetical protein OO17_20445 [Rhodopseudomonas palustris]|uniref:Bll5862 protein n=1 Tax=Rhodopseudomonas palustris TaxID=1076 RepID=A0A0D7EG03_RHOPL|nr:hypothetical protein OO17_20445 [Rhodopseudomonas palustris]
MPNKDKPAPGTAYAYKASLIGAAQQFELTEGGLSWRVGGKSGLWPYDRIASVRLSYRPVSMQSRRFRADIADRGGGRISIISTTWHTAALMAPQDEAYRAFIMALHRRMQQAGSQAALVGGLKPAIHIGAMVLMALLGVAMTGLLARAVATAQWGGVLFIVGFVALFAWQIGGFIRRNKPRSYTFDDLPKGLLP